MKKEKGKGIQFFAYGLTSHKNSVSAILEDFSVVSKPLTSLYKVGFEYEIFVLEEDIETIAAQITAIPSCWIQPDRKTDFIDPIKMYTHTYAVPVDCAAVETEMKIIKNAILSCSLWGSVGCTKGLWISSEADCSNAKRIYNDINTDQTSEFEMIDLSTIHFKRYDPAKACYLLVEGVVGE